MNVEPPDFAMSLPPLVKPGSGNGIYQVQSVSNPKVWRNVDVTLLQCDCPAGRLGRSRQAHKRLGYLPRSHFCRHLQEALIFHSIATICALERGLQNSRPASDGEPL